MTVMLLNRARHKHYFSCGDCRQLPWKRRLE